jgi:uncharacterized protein
VKIIYHQEKRDDCLRQRGLDFEDAVHVFAGPRLDIVDDRFPYPEVRIQTYGLLNGRLVMVVWTQLRDACRVISMRKCNAKEEARFRQRLR